MPNNNKNFIVVCQDTPCLLNLSARTMRRRRIIILLFLLLIIAVVVFLFLGFFKPKRAGIIIESNPQAIVFINGEQVGRTPLRTDFSPQEVDIKLVPESFDRPHIPFDTKVELVPGIQTIIRRVLGESVESSEGEVVSFKKIGNTETGISVVSTPDGAQVKLDGVLRGSTPINITDIGEGTHQLSVGTTGFKERNFSVKTENGHRLTAVVNLAASGEPLAPPMPASTQAIGGVADDKKEQKVEILTTPTGFLRVREGPKTSSAEVTRVNPKERYELLETDKDTGWFKIKIGEEKEGWVSNEYATVSAEVDN